jgi:hypothetical protein
MFEKSNKTLDYIINCQRSPFIKTGLGYDAFVSSLPTPIISTTRGILFVVGGVQTGLLEEQPIVDCGEQIDEFSVSHMP